MKRFGLLFVLLAVLAVGAGILVWWAGPKLVSLAVLDAQRDQPYLVLNLSRSSATESHTSRYRTPLAGLMASEGGVALARYRLLHLMQGERADNWMYLDQFHLSEAASVAQVMTSSPFRMLDQHLTDFDSLQLGQYMSQPPRWGKVIALWLVQEREAAVEDALVVIEQHIGLGQGRVVWQSHIDVLSSQDNFNRIMVMSFDTEQQAWDWLRHKDVVAARGIANARANRLALTVYIREGDGGAEVGPS